MKTEFSTSWKASRKPRKQRKYVKNAPLHIKGKLLGAHLSKELRKKYSKRTLRVRKGDKVRIAVGQFRGKIGKVLAVDVKATKVQVENVEIIKKDGSKIPFLLNPSNLIITELNSDDKLRMNSLEAKK